VEKGDWLAIGFVDIAEAGSNRAVLPPSPRPATTRGSEGSETAPDTGDGGRGDAKGGGSVHEYHDADTPPHTNPRNTPFRRQSLDRQTSLSECAPHTFSLPLSGLSSVCMCVHMRVRFFLLGICMWIFEFTTYS